MTRRLSPWIGAAAGFSLVLLYLPMLAVAVFSVNTSRYGLVWRGFTMDWYVRLFHNPYVLEAARNTLVLALVSTVISTALGTLMALGMHRFPWPGWVRRVLDFCVYLPVVTPDIIFAVAAVVSFALLRVTIPLFEPGLFTMICAHVAFQIAFVELVVASRLATIGRSVEEAARDLYADAWYAMRHVTLPLLMPGIAAGALMAFTLSLDDFVISFFTAGPESVTLPIFIYASLRRGVTPEIHALSTLIFLATIVLVLTVQFIIRKPEEV